jgi:hypothetical protein
MSKRSEDLKAFLTAAAAATPREDLAEGDFRQSVLWLAEHLGCPDDQPIMPWLAERGLMRLVGPPPCDVYVFTDEADKILQHEPR